MTLSTCPSCAGFLPPATESCPHCGSACSAPTPPRRAGRLVAAASSGLMAITLMACYGGGPVEPCVDDDDDGYFANAGLCWAGSEEDCDDGNADVHPGADDPMGDGVDQNCDGVDGVAAESTGESSTTTDASATAGTTTDGTTTDDGTTADGTTTDGTTTDTTGA